MDEALQLVFAMSERHWKRFTDELKDWTTEEIQWRLLPQANNMHVILKHLWVEEQLYLANLEHGEQSPYRDPTSLQQLTESVPLEFAQTLEELKELHNCCVRGHENPCSADTRMAMYHQHGGVLPHVFGARYAPQPWTVGVEDEHDLAR
jgi:hypothetical protein